MLDPTFADLGRSIKESIEKVGENKKKLADLKKQVLDTVQELEILAQGNGGNMPTGELLRALDNLTAAGENQRQLPRACPDRFYGASRLRQSVVQAVKIEGEIKKLRENRTYCYDQFQLFSQARLEGHTARTEATAHTNSTERHAARTEGHAVRTESITVRTEARHQQIGATLISAHEV
ncbi:hypothetical protein C8R47DRAFT_1120960 [Mycena vitilis]|nr:hypothetical protein C8R47DRAFT_1120960 [Mycena vitilis]